MHPDRIELLERAALSLVVQALKDYRTTAATIFREETDEPQDIAEDVTREALEEMGVSGIKERLYGKVDVKKAIYLFLPEVQPVALMLDAKAEKGDERSATIQMSQTSMRVRMYRKGQAIDEAGKLDTVIRRGNRDLVVVTIVAKYLYQEPGALKKIIVACIPNGLLQNRYNPTADDTIWRIGRDAPTLGEDFRVRLSYPKLRHKAEWRVVEVIV